MNLDDSATLTAGTPLPLRPTSGLWWGLLGVLAFSFTVPFTRVAVAGLPPAFIGAGRAAVAAVLAALALALTRQRLPSRAQWRRLAVVGGGIVVGFPLLTSYALTTVPASHGAVVIALLPAATATAAVLRTGERPPGGFWVAVALGSAVAVAFAALQSGGLGALQTADLLLFGAVVAAAVGYAEGGLLARELGAWQTVSWALVLCAPVMLALTGMALRDGLPSADATQWAAFGYLAAISMFLGFFAWYRGLAIGPIAQVSQVQLVQPVLSIAWAGLFLAERITLLTAVGGLAVIACAAAAVRTRSAGNDPRHRANTSLREQLSRLLP